jgi:hypothetical protein
MREETKRQPEVGGLRPETGRRGDQLIRDEKTKSLRDERRGSGKVGMGQGGRGQVS